MKQIPRFPNYSITDTGNIWSHLQNKWLKPSKGRVGYLQLSLGKDKSERVHRLLLETFVSPCPEGMEACHNNGIKDDNRLENLRWDTKSNNTIDSIRHGTAVCIRIGEKSNHHKLTEIKVKNIKKMLSNGVKQSIIAKTYNVCQNTINNINTGRVWKHIK